MTGRFRPDIALIHGVNPVAFQKLDWEALQCALVPALEAAAEMFDNAALPQLVRRDPEGTIQIIDMAEWTTTPLDTIHHIDAETTPCGNALLQWGQLGIADHFPAKYREIAETDLVQSLFNQPIQQSKFDWAHHLERLTNAEAHIADEVAPEEIPASFTRPQAKILATLRYQNLEQTLFSHVRSIGTAIQDNLTLVDEFSTPSLLTLPHPRYRLAQARLLATVMQHVGERAKATSADVDLWSRLMRCGDPKSPVYFDIEDLGAIEVEARDCSPRLQAALRHAVTQVREAMLLSQGSEITDNPLDPEVYL